MRKNMFLIKQWKMYRNDKENILNCKYQSINKIYKRIVYNDNHP